MYEPLSPAAILSACKIVIADDEPDMLDLTRRALLKEGFVIDTAIDGEIALELIRNSPPDLAILDLMMPKMSGLEVCKAVRAGASTANLPLIILSARSAEVDRIVALEIGADDYVTKPFSPRELTLRVKALLRRVPASRSASGSISLGEIALDTEAHTVAVAGAEIPVTTIEFRLLRHFLEAPHRVHSREELLEKVWGQQRVELRTIDTQIRRLRDRLGSAADQIETVRAFGYRMTDGPMRE